MATVYSKIFEHQGKKQNGTLTYNVKIAVYHKSETKYIKTEHWLVPKQISDWEIKDKFVKNAVDQTLINYRKRITELDEKLHLYSCESLKKALQDKKEEVNFIKFCKEYIEELDKNEQDKHAAGLNTVTNHLIDFFKTDKVSPNEITVDMLKLWDKHLRKPRTIVRPNKEGIPCSMKTPGCKDAGVHNYMRDLRILFNEACTRYNKKALGIILIPHDPFDEYSIIDAPETRKRNIALDRLLQIRDCTPKPGSLAELARDVYMLSFYLCGMNAKDLYNIRKENIVGGRLNYNRSKTKRKRKDNAFISIKIIPEARALLNKYIGTFAERYAESGNFNHALGDGMKELNLMFGWKDNVTPYSVRATFASLARNKCRIPKADVSEALNHVDKGRATTDIYIERDWSTIDIVQKRVMLYVNKIPFTRPLRTKKKENYPAIKVMNILKGVILNPITLNV